MMAIEKRNFSSAGGISTIGPITSLGFVPMNINLTLCCMIVVSFGIALSHV